MNDTPNELKTEVPMPLPKFIMKYGQWWYFIKCVAEIVTYTLICAFIITWWLN